MRETLTDKQAACKSRSWGCRIIRTSRNQPRPLRVFGARPPTVARTLYLQTVLKGNQQHFLYCIMSSSPAHPIYHVAAHGPHWHVPVLHSSGNRIPGIRFLTLPKPFLPRTGKCVRAGVHTDGGLGCVVWRVSAIAHSGFCLWFAGGMDTQ